MWQTLPIADTKNGHCRSYDPQNLPRTQTWPQMVIGICPRYGWPCRVSCPRPASLIFVGILAFYIGPRLPFKSRQGTSFCSSPLQPGISLIRPNSIRGHPQLQTDTVSREQGNPSHCLVLPDNAVIRVLRIKESGLSRIDGNR